MVKKTRGPSGSDPTALSRRENARLEKALDKAMSDREKLDLEILELKVRLAMGKNPKGSEACLATRILEGKKPPARKKP